MYPDALVSMRKYDLFSRVYLFVCFVAALLLACINAAQQSEIWWSIIAGLGLLYSYLVLRYAVIGKSGYRSKVIVLALLGVLALIAVDFVAGYRGWSVDYVLPAGMLAMDAVIVLCMFFNRRCWQSYIMWILGMLLLSLLPVALNMAELESNRYMACLPLAATLLLLLGTMIIGGRRAAEEIRRRFHIR